MSNPAPPDTDALRAALQENPGDTALRAEFATRLMRTGRLIEAEHALRDGLAADGTPRALQILYAQCAERRQNVTLAAQRWQQLADVDPADAEAADALVRLATLGGRRTAAGALAPQPSTQLPIPPVAESEQEAVQELMMQFESLGANCEFGLLQRQLGCAPLGLMRFSAALPHSVITLLRTRFDGMGVPGKMKITTGKDEYAIVHPGSHWSMHTRIAPSTRPDIDAVEAEQIKRTAFLTKKLIGDLEAHKKIFVYQRPGLTDAQINKIYAAMDEYGPNWLLCVRPADADHQAGSVEWRTDRLMIGAIDKLGKDGPNGWSFSLEHWVAFCRHIRDRKAEAEDK